MVSKMECPKSMSNYKNLIIKLGVNIRNIESTPCHLNTQVQLLLQFFFYKWNLKTFHIVFEFFYLSGICVGIISKWNNFSAYELHLFQISQIL